MNIEMSGWYKMVVTRPDGTVRLDTDWFPNIILDQGLERLGQNTNWMTYAHVGSGSTAPAAAQTALTSYINHNDTVTPDDSARGDNVASGYTWIRRGYRFSNGGAAGNISEVGVSWQTNNGGLFSRALILDQSNNPTTITILGDETLDLYYEIRVYPNLSDVTASLTLNGTVHNVTIRPSNFGGWFNQSYFYFYGSGFNSAPSPSSAANAYTDPTSQGLGATSTGPGGTTLPIPNATNVTKAPYVANSRKVAWEITAGLNNMVGRIDHIIFDTSIGYYKANFNPPIQKTAQQILKLTHELTWSRKVI